MTPDGDAGTVTAPAAVGPTAKPDRTDPSDTPAPPSGHPPAEDQPPPRPSDHVDAPSAAPFEAAQHIPRALQIAGSVIAPTTLLTALSFYFGLLYAIAYYRHFGVNYTVLDVPTQGYLILSVSTAILPMALIAGTALLAVWLYQLPLNALTGTPRRVASRVIYPLVGGTGFLLVGAVMADALFGAVMYPPALLEARGLSLSVGVVLLAYAGRLRRTLFPPRRSGATPVTPVALTVAKWGSFCPPARDRAFLGGWELRDPHGLGGCPRVRGKSAVRSRGGAVQREGPQPRVVGPSDGGVVRPRLRVRVPLFRSEAGPAGRRQLPLGPRRLATGRPARARVGAIGPAAPRVRGRRPPTRLLKLTDPSTAP